MAAETDEWNEFEKEEETYWSSEKSAILGRLAKKYEEAGDKARLQDMLTEMKLLNLVFAPAGYPYPPNVWAWCAENINKPYPLWDANNVGYYKRRLTETSNILHKARYAYAIWTLAKQIDYAHIAVENFFRFAETFHQRYPDEVYEDADSYFEVSFNLSLTIGSLATKDPKTIFNRVSEILKEVEVNSRGGHLSGSLLDLIFKMGRSLISKRQFKQDRGVIEIIKNASVIARRIAGDSADSGELHKQQTYLDRAAKLLQLLGENEDAKKIRVQIALSLEKQAEQMKSSSFLHSQYSQMAAKVYFDLGMADKVKELGVQIEQDTKKALETEFKEVSQTFTIPVGELVSDYLRKVATMGPAELLNRIASIDDGNFIPDLKRIAISVAKIKKTMPLTFIIPRTEFDNFAPTRLVSDEEKIEDMEINRQFLLEAGIRLTVMSTLFTELVPNRIKKEEIIAFLKQSKNFSSADIELVSSALNSYLSADYIAFSHVAMPRIENEMKAILRNKGNTTMKYDPQDSGFDQLLMGGIVRELKQYLPENLHKFLEVWYTQEGDNLRNKISHGWLETNKFDKRLADVLLYTIIRLSSI